MKRILAALKSMLLLAAMLAFLPLAASAQVVPDWQRSTPGTTGVAMALDATDNVYLLGITSPTIYDAGVGTAVISRYSAAGVLQWSRTWFPPGVSYAGARPLSVFTDVAGNAIVIGGISEWNFIFCSQITPTCTGVSGVFDAGWLVLKYSPDGTLLWTHSEVHFLGHLDRGVVDAQGDIYVTGRGGSFSSMNTTMKLSGSNGATLWSVSSPAQGETPGDIRLTPSGHVVVSGAGVNGMSLYAYAADTGATVWSAQYAQAAGNYAPGLAVGSTGEIVATGSAGSSLFVAALDSNYLPLFARTYPEGSQGRRVVVDGQRNIFVTGVASTPTNWVTLTLDLAGNLLQAPRVVDFHSSANEVPRDMALGSDGSLFVAGSSGPGTATDPLATRAATARYLPDGSLAWFASTPDATAAVAVKAATDGAVFVLGNSAQTLMHYPANRPPVAVALASASAGTAPLTVNFSSAGSTDLDGSIVSYAWDFGDGQTSIAANPSHTYAVGSYAARLTVTDNLGATSTSAPIPITVIAPPPPVPTALTLAKSAVSGGNSTTATVTVSSNVGVTLALASSNTAVASVPATVVIPAGAIRATFTVRTSRVRRDTVVTITATANGTSATALLTVRNR